MSVRDMLMAAAGVDTGGGSDDNFKNVTLLLNGDGTNGAQNNTFVDSSSNNFSITRNGNTTQGSFSPYGSLWSNYFNASSTNYIKFPANSAFQLTGDFTIEGWFNPDGTLTSGAGTLVGDYYYGTSESTGQFQVCWNANAKTINSYFVSGAGAVENYAVGTAPISTWNHFALVRSGSTVRLYLNGQGGSTTSTSATFGSNVGMWIGIDGNGINEHFGGSISNIRIVKGTAIYNVASSTLTVPTTPLTAVSGTSLLTCQSNRFIDNSSNAFAVTVTGTPSVQRFSPFNPTLAYDTTTIGGSGYFSTSTGDYLSLPSNTAFNFGSGNFTFEAWIYPTNLSDGMTIFADVQYWYAFLFRVQTNGSVYSTSYPDGGSSPNWDFSSSASQVLLNNWSHVALVRNSSTLTIYVNGVSVATSSFGGSVSNASSPRIGHNDSYSDANGYISDVRIVKGTAVYTSAFTPPTTPLTAISGTSLLTSMTNASIADYAMMDDLETRGSAQISTSVKKFGTGSLYFNNNGYVLVNHQTNVAKYGTGDFTVELWFYCTQSPTVDDTDEYLYDTRPNGTNGAYSSLYIKKTNSNIAWMNNGTDRILSGTFTFNEWHHLAVCRSGTDTKMFLDGTQVGSTYTDTTDYDCGRLTLASSSYGLNSLRYYGYLDDVRITKGYARYTANFTPPTAALPTK